MMATMTGRILNDIRLPLLTEFDMEWTSVVVGAMIGTSGFVGLRLLGFVDLL
jgi:hypothetical protein